MKKKLAILLALTLTMSCTAFAGCGKNDDVAVSEDTKLLIIPDAGTNDVIQCKTLNENGITLVPFNLNNSDGYKPTFYNKEQIEKLPVKIIGVAVEKRTKL